MLCVLDAASAARDSGNEDAFFAEKADGSAAAFALAGFGGQGLFATLGPAEAGRHVPNGAVRRTRREAVSRSEPCSQAVMNTKNVAQRRSRRSPGKSPASS